jgi:hypothetical protein
MSDSAPGYTRRLCPTVPLFCAVLLLIQGTYGFAEVVKPAWRPLLFLSGSGILLVLLGSLAASCLSWEGADGRVAARCRIVEEFVYAFPTLMIASAIYFLFPNAVAVPAGTLVIAMCVGLRMFYGPHIVVAWTGFAVSMLLAIKFVTTDLNPDVADMLPVIMKQAEFFLSNLSPYGQSYSAVTDGPVYYLPLQWLFYTPLVAFRVDPRFLNILCLGGTAALFLFAIRNAKSHGLYAGMLIGTLASKPSIEMLVQGHMWPIWFLCAAYCATIAARRWITAAAILGALLASSQTMILLFALAAVYQLKALGLLRAVLLSALSLSVYLIFMLPFSGLSAGFFLDHYVYLPMTAGLYSEIVSNNPLLQLSLADLVANSGIWGSRPWLQVMVGLGGMIALGFKAETGITDFLKICGICYLAAISLNIQVWRYYYMPGLLLLLWGCSVPHIWRLRTVGFQGHP